MKSPDRVQPDHFLRQFDRYPEGEERLRAMAAHCAALFNTVRGEEESHKATVQRVLEALCLACPTAAVVRDLVAQLHDMESE